LGAIAEVRVRIPNITAGGDDDDDGSKQPTARKVVRWEGDVPPQKWMNFYTKVLSRFASTQGLQLRVSFEAPADDEQSQAKADEARSGLKELGLDDDIQVS
jgi:hypothetical protein